MKPVWIGCETDYLYDGQMPVMKRDYNSSGNLSQTRVNVLGARGIEGIITVPASGSASMKWLMYDGHGNMVRTIGTSFTLSAYQWRGVWGERQTGTLQTGRGYCANLGHQEDETGLVYMRARYYEPTTGRFITEDPARDGVNWYLYADGNPVNRVDASGKIAGPLAIILTSIAFAIGMFIGLTAGYMYAVYCIQQDDPLWKASPPWFVEIGIAIASFIGAEFTQFKEGVHGYKRKGITWGRVFVRMGLAGGIGFIFGFAFGMLIASMNYLAFHDQVEIYREGGVL